jgi:ATP-dependent Clp protease adaptor protein ClpS
MSTSPGVIEDIEVKTKVKVDRPSKWVVILHNDNYTSQDFVVFVLIDIFRKSMDDAVAIMLHIHNHGRGVAGSYSSEIARQKAAETIKLARTYGHPLVATVEENRE